MADRAAARFVTAGKLRLSRAPISELAAAALKAEEVAGLTGADFIVIAVPAGTADATAAPAEAAAQAAIDGRRPTT